MMFLSGFSQACGVAMTRRKIMVAGWGAIVGGVVGWWHKRHKRVGDSPMPGKGKVERELARWPTPVQVDVMPQKNRSYVLGVLLTRDKLVAGSILRVIGPDGKDNPVVRNCGLEISGDDTAEVLGMQLMPMQNEIQLLKERGV